MKAKATPSAQWLRQRTVRLWDIGRPLYHRICILELSSGLSNHASEMAGSVKVSSIRVPVISRYTVVPFLVYRA